MSSITTDLAEALGTVERPGDFFTAGTAQLLAPRLEVDGVGPIALPLLPVQAEQLIAAAERAPFGRGEDTLTDITVRRTWQIGPSQVRIGGRRWPSTLESVVERAAEGLGVAGAVGAEFYKLLIYDRGSFFVRHRDTEKSPGMFATLILVLPSLSEGGELVVRHKDREARLSLRCEDPSEVAFAAFYADCVHEVLPITAGYRLALIYNLVRIGGEAGAEPPDHTSQEDAVVRLLTQWAAEPRTSNDDDAHHNADNDDDAGDDDDYFDEDGDEEVDDEEDDDDVDDDEGNGPPEKLVLALEHAYTPAELSFRALKGADSAVAKLVVAAAGRAGCDVHLALITVEESGSAEYSGNWRPRRRGSRYDDDADDGDADFEVVEVVNRSVRATNWCRPDGDPSALTEIPVWDKEFSPPDAFDDREPDEQHFHEATGNEGASFERTYQRAALVLWPRDRLLAIINQAGLSVTLPYLTDLVDRWAASGESTASASWREANTLATHMVATWKFSRWSPSPATDHTPTGRMLRQLVRLGDKANAVTILAALADRGGLDMSDATPMVEALGILPPEHAGSLLTRIVSTSNEAALAA